MKRNFVILTCLLYCFCASVAQTYVSVTTVKTPNNTTVQDVDSLIIPDVSYNTSQLAVLSYDLYNNYNGAELIEAPSYKYNCHAYAWHVSENGSKVVIGSQYATSEDVYWTDGSYIEVSESIATKVSYHQNGNHSAIRLNSVWYQSKWGSDALVKHHPNDVPIIYQPSMTKKYYLRAPTISGDPNPYNLQNTMYTIANLPPNTSVTWSATPNVTILSGQGTNQVTISICGSMTTSLTATLSGAIDTSGLKDGMYILNIIEGNGKTNKQKVMVKH